MRSVVFPAFRVAAMALALGGIPAVAQETITLKVAHPLPETHYSWELGIKKMLDSITEATDGRVQFEVYPANQLGRDAYGLLRSGIADMAMIVPLYAPDKFPLTGVTEFSSFYDTTCEAAEKYWELARPGGALDAAEYGAQGLRVVFAMTTAPQRYMTSSKPVASLGDAGGLKIYAAGSALPRALRAVGSIPISITASELYDSVSRGTVDGALFPYSSTNAYKLGGKLRHEVGGVKFGVSSWFVGMSESRFAALPEDVQQAITAAGLPVQQSFCAWTDEDDENIRQSLIASGELTVSELPEAEVRLWRERLLKAAQEWAAEMDAAGKNGTELLEAMAQAGAGE